MVLLLFSSVGFSSSFMRSIRGMLATSSHSFNAITAVVTMAVLNGVICTCFPMIEV